MKFEGRKWKIVDRETRELNEIVQRNRRETIGAISVIWNNTTNKELSKRTCKNNFNKLGYKFYKVEHLRVFVFNDNLLLRQKK